MFNCIYRYFKLTKLKKYHKERQYRRFVCHLIRDTEPCCKHCGKFNE